ncbi:aminopeptidase N-like [Glandiceps talaboti]
MAKGDTEAGGRAVKYLPKKKPSKEGFFIGYPVLCFAIAIILLLLIFVILMVYFLHPGYGCPQVTDDKALPVLRPKDDPREFGGRLPDNLKPTNYRIKITPYMDEDDDDKRFFFDGEVGITINCEKSTNVITLHALKLNIDEDTVRVNEIDTNEDMGVKGISTDEEYDFFIVQTKKKLQSGKQYYVCMNYSGIVNNSDSMALYIGTYQIGGEIRYILASQLETIHARRVFPSFDEPAFKASFDIVVRHRNTRSALSNMPNIKNETDGEWNTAYYNTTPVMPTYLVAITVSDFHCKEAITSAGVKFRVWAAEDRLNKTTLALDTGVKSLAYFEDLMGIPYSLSKIDMIALPVFRFGAMENWGLITYAERAMLFDDEVHPPSDSLISSIIICHELAHMWFGNLVTLGWWGDSWLNEGFATYFEYEPLTSVFPEWDIHKNFRHGVMVLKAFENDASSSSHPTVQPKVGWKRELMQQFDSRVYQRGGSIILMMTTFLENHGFQDGLRNYLQKHSYSNTYTDDLWGALTESALDAGLDIDIKEVMDPWVLQFGFPVLNVTRTSQSKATVHQRHFLLDPFDDIPESDMGYTWYVPLTYVHSADMSYSEPSRAWIDKSSDETVIDLSGATSDDWILANINGHGYYIVNYDLENWNKIILQLNSNHKVVPANNRAALIFDAFNLARSGDVDAVLAFRVVDYLSTEEGWAPWQAFTRNLEFASDMLRKTPSYGNFEKYIRDLIRPSYERHGWDFTNDDDHLADYHLQLEAIKLSCAHNNGECVKKAKEIYSEWTKNVEDVRMRSDFRKTVACTVIRHGDLTEWQSAFNILVTTTDSETKNHLRSALGCTGELWLLRKYLMRMFELYKNESETDNLIPNFMRPWDFAVDRYDVFKVIHDVGKQSALGSLESWRFATEYFDDLRNKSESQAFQVMWEFADNMNTKVELTKLEDFARKYNDMPEDQVKEFYKAQRKVKANIRWMDRNYNQLEKWLEYRVSKR